LGGKGKGRKKGRGGKGGRRKPPAILGGLIFICSYHGGDLKEKGKKKRKGRGERHCKIQMRMQPMVARPYGEKKEKGRGGGEGGGKRGEDPLWIFSAVKGNNACRPSTARSKKKKKKRGEEKKRIAAVRHIGWKHDVSGLELGTNKKKKGERGKKEGRGGKCIKLVTFHRSALWSHLMLSLLR